ncbi:50S ribosomal protein L6 [candidate division WOR-3 bacterium]|nr:50S ribosomal protein L6 [candidate division WOR-3 bacterium]
MAKNYRPIPIPATVQVTTGAGQVTVNGKLGELKLPLLAGVEAEIKDKELVVSAGAGVPRARVGTVRALVRNAIVGVTEGYEKALQVRGMGYRVQKAGAGVQISCGYSHQVDVTIPAGLSVDVNQLPNPDDTKQQMFEIVLKGIDKQLVGEVAAEIHTIKPPDNYQGKGIRYRGERVVKKAGKRAVGSQG